MLKILFLLSIFPIVWCQSCNKFLNCDNDDCIVTLKVPRVSNQNIDVKIEVLGNSWNTASKGSLDLFNTAEVAQDDVKDGNPLKYRVKLPTSSSKIIKIVHNGRTVCEERKGQYTGLVTLSHGLTTGYDLGNNYDSSHDYDPNPVHQQVFGQLNNRYPNTNNYLQPTLFKPQRIETTRPPTTTRSPVAVPFNRPVRPNYQFEIQQQVFIPNYQYSTTKQTSTTRRTTTRRTTTRRTTTGQPSENFMCGERRSKLKAQATSLIFSGTKVAKHDFPWLVAHFYGPSERGFICGGSLVSHRIVVTAGHCIHEKGSERISEYDSTYYLGKHKLSTISDAATIASGVEEFITHEDWNPQETRYVADIGIAVLTKHIRFTDWIRPICIWDRVQSHSELAGDIGTVAGWGLTKDGNLSEEPMSIEVPIVDDEECRASQDVLSEIKDATNFCIGDGSGRTPCQGDSGGGFIVRRGPRFYLRGIVSAAILVDGECSEKDFAVMTDVAQYSSWISNYIAVNG